MSADELFGAFDEQPTVKELFEEVTALFTTILDEGLSAEEVDELGIRSYVRVRSLYIYDEEAFKELKQKLNEWFEQNRGQYFHSDNAKSETILESWAQIKGSLARFFENN